MVMFVRKFLENFHREDNVGAKGMDPTGFALHGTQRQTLQLVDSQYIVVEFIMERKMKT